MNIGVTLSGIASSLDADAALRVGERVRAAVEERLQRQIELPRPRGRPNWMRPRKIRDAQMNGAERR